MSSANARFAPDPVLGDARDSLDELAVGVIGCGEHSCTAILPSLRHAPVRLVAVCDLDRDRTERARRLFGAERSYSSLDDLLERERLDLVIIVGPPELHVAGAVAALEAGHHVFIEKPPGHSLHDALTIQRAARDARRQVMVGFMKRHASAYRLVAQVLADPSFGPLTSVELTYAHWPVQDLRLHLTDMSIHAIDTVRWLLGEPAGMSVYKRRLGEGHVLALMIEHVGGAVSRLDLSGMQPGVQEHLVVSGDGAVLTARNMASVELVRQAGGLPYAANGRETTTWTPELTLPDSENDLQVLQGYATELIVLTRAIREHRPAHASIDDGVAAMALIEAIDAAPEGLSVLSPLAADGAPSASGSG